jgi:hypothetical protein
MTPAPSAPLPLTGAVGAGLKPAPTQAGKCLCISEHNLHHPPEGEGRPGIGEPLYLPWQDNRIFACLETAILMRHSSLYLLTHYIFGLSAKLHCGGKIAHALRLYKTAIVNPELSLRSSLDHVIMGRWVTTKAVMV